MKMIFKYIAVSVIALSVAFSAVTYAMVTDTFSENGTASTDEVNISFSTPVAASRNEFMNWNVSSASTNSFAVDIQNLYPGAQNSFEAPIVNSGTLAAILDSMSVSFEGTPTDTMLAMLGINVEVLGPNDVVLYNLADATVQGTQADDRFDVSSESLLRFSSLGDALSQQAYTFRVQPGAASSRIKITVGMDGDEEGKYTSSGGSGQDDSATENQSVAFTMAFNWSGETVTEDSSSEQTGDGDPVVSDTIPQTDIEDTPPPLGSADDVLADGADGTATPPPAAAAAIADGAPPLAAAVAAPVDAVAADALEIVIEDATPPLAAADTPEVEIEDSEVPLAPGASTEWALMNLLLALFTAMLSVFLLLGYFRRKEHNEDDVIKNKGAMRLFSLAPAISAVVTFLVTEDMSLPMTLFDSWTILMAVIALLQCAVVVMSKKDIKTKQEEV